MNDKKVYASPEAEIVLFDRADIITTSGGEKRLGLNIGEWDLIED